MHIALAILTVLAALRWVKWNEWKSYYPTMLYFSFGNIMAGFLIQDFHLWEFHPDFEFMTYPLIEILYTVVIFPLSTLLFLQRFPKNLKQQIWYFVQWILIYAAVEAIGSWTHRIDYHNGWNLAWSILFDCVMFPMLLLHHKRTGLALCISVLFAVAYAYVFHVPLVHKTVD